MKTKFLAISLFFAFMMMIFHEMFPHHHHEPDDDILFSHHHNSNEQSGQSVPMDNHHFPFPVHHHLSDSEDFDLVRTGSGSENFGQSSVFYVLFYLPHSLILADSDPPEKIYYDENPVPLNSYPFIISPNAMRGSPAFA